MTGIRDRGGPPFGPAAFSMSACGRSFFCACASAKAVRRIAVSGEEGSSASPRLLPRRNSLLEERRPPRTQRPNQRRAHRQRRFRACRHSYRNRRASPPTCRSCGSCERGGPANDARAALHRRLRACRRSYRNRRASRSACRRCGSCENDGPANDARAALHRRFCACRRSYRNRRASPPTSRSGGSRELSGTTSPAVSQSKAPCSGPCFMSGLAGSGREGNGRKARRPPPGSAGVEVVGHRS